jgi:hypothetical protein
MTERYLSINGGDSSKNGKKIVMIKTYSFTTDDDEASSTATPEPVLTNREKLLRVNSASIDSVQNDDNTLDVPVGKVKKRKPRRTTEVEV